MLQSISAHLRMLGRLCLRGAKHCKANSRIFSTAKWFASVCSRFGSMISLVFPSENFFMACININPQQCMKNKWHWVSWFFLHTCPDWVCVHMNLLLDSTWKLYTNEDVLWLYVPILDYIHIVNGYDIQSYTSWGESWFRFVGFGVNEEPNQYFLVFSKYNHRCPILYYQINESVWFFDFSIFFVALLILVKKWWEKKAHPFWSDPLVKFSLGFYGAPACD